MTQEILIPMLTTLDLWSDIAGGFNWLMTPLYWVISGVLVLFHSFFSLFIDPASGWCWAFSIILLTLLVRTCLIPLFVKQINSTRNTQLLQPKIQELQQKYKNDREKLGQAQMALYQEEGVNPMAACFPVLFQMPVFLALFWVLSGAARNQPVGYWLETNKGLVDSLRDGTIFGAKISGTFMPFEVWGVEQTLSAIMIVLMVCTLFITQLQIMRKNMPPAAKEGPMAQQQKIMLFLFPVMYAFGGGAMPIGVLVYWLTTNLWTLGQQSILVHNNPTPGTPAFLDWEDRMRKKGLDPDEIVKDRREKQREKIQKKKGKKSGIPGTAKTTNGKPGSQATGTNSSGKSGATAAKGIDTPGASRPVGENGKPVVVRRQQTKKTSRARRKS